MLRRATRLTRGFGIARPSYSVRLYSDSSSSFSSSEDSNQGYQQQSGSDFRQRDTANTVHFSGLPLSATREKFSEALTAAGLNGVTRVNVPTSAITHGSRGFAFVTFDTPENAANAKTFSVNYEGTPLRIASARTREESQKLKIYIGDLDYNLQDSALKSAVEGAFGPVDYASVATHRGLSKGFGFATFKSSEDAEKARAVGKLMIDGKPARIESVRDREPRQPREGGSGRYERDSYGSDRGYGSRGGDRGSDRYGSRGGDSYGSDRGYGSSSRGESNSYGSDRGYGSRGSSSRGESSGYGSDRGYGSSSRGSDRGYGSSSRGSSSDSSEGYGSTRGGYGSSSGSSSY